MILYLTSSNGGSLLDETSACAEAACGLFGSPHNHLCFTAEPLAGRGPFVHTIDLPMEEAKRYEIKNEFRSPSARFYAVPLEVLRGLPIKEDTFEAVTGRKWNEWVLPVLDRRDVPKGSKVRGKWAMVWASREGIASVRVHRKLEGRGQTVYLSVQVTTTSDFDPATDYIVLEEHTESERDGGGVKETWRLETLAGTTPQWVIFPKAWQEFVWSPAVADSAADFILNLAPDAWEEVTLGRKKGSKADKARAWRRASSAVGKSLSALTGRRVDLGLLSGHTWTQVASMPIRIARRASEALPPTRTGWEPPFEEPEYINPDDSGRYLLANLYGTYPTHGPGADHSPQNRAYQKREGELTGEVRERPLFRLAA